MTARSAKTSIGLLSLLLLATLSSLPVRADTAGELSAARARLSAVQANLNQLARAYAGAQTAFANTQDAIDALKGRIGRVHDRMSRIQGQLAARAREAYESGGISTLELLLSSESFSQFSDRIQYLGSVARGDQDLLVEAAVNRESLNRSEDALKGLSSRQAATIASLAGQKRAIADALAEAQALETKLAGQLAAERAAAAAAARARAEAEARIVGGGPLQACPVGQPRTFYDDFGDPRPGGRTHQGIDLLAPEDTPVYAAQAGRFVKNYNDLGGISALVYASNGDYTYYAHMHRYAGVGDGATVPAGTQIGYVGNTGDAQGGPFHLHFEYHPGGGSAVDPYQQLVAICG